MRIFIQFNNIIYSEYYYFSNIPHIICDIEINKIINKFCLIYSYMIKYSAFFNQKYYTYYSY